MGMKCQPQALERQAVGPQVLVRRDPGSGPGQALPAGACAPCLLVEGDVTTYLHEDEPYSIKSVAAGFNALLATDDGRMVGVQFER